jgi:hypothetical protein
MALAVWPYEYEYEYVQSRPTAYSTIGVRVRPS